MENEVIWGKVRNVTDVEPNLILKILGEKVLKHFEIAETQKKVTWEEPQKHLDVAKTRFGNTTTGAMQRHQRHWKRSHSLQDGASELCACFSDDAP